MGNVYLLVQMLVYVEALNSESIYVKKLVVMGCMIA